MDPDASPSETEEDRRVPVQRPDYFAGTRRGLGSGLIAFVWIGYLVPVVAYAAGVPLVNAADAAQTYLTNLAISCGYWNVT